ncbi:MAG: primosomal protein DnaI [Bacilli bacterium]|nr:primosomal protein DnaI [Bacilli bacterium]
MKSIGNVIKENYYVNTSKLESNYKEALENNSTFKKIATSLKLPSSYLMKYTSSLEESSKELDNCKKCKNIMQCKNSYTGHVLYPNILSDNLVFDYVPCKYKKELDERNKYKKNIYLFEVPKEIKEASMKNIDLDNHDRFKIIKWLKKFLDNYQAGAGMKGIYLTGNFGCGKTYLISAALNELAKKDHKIAIIYYPEFLRSLKESFSDPEVYNEKFRMIKRVEVLLIDDIGAETMTEWSRDEVLGTILQYRMQEGLTTFFTSNLTVKDLEEHFSYSAKGIEKVKAKRIIERIKQLTEEMTLISENKRLKENESEEKE